jgi:predicted metal-dependent phosphoesterase TrpH
MRLELHCHSTCSDGTDAPERVAARAAEREVAVFALTDHDTCAGSGIAVPGARTIRAVELSCDDQGRTIHVLAYDRGGAGWAALETRLEAVRVARVNRLRVMAAKLAQRGVRLDIEPLVAEASRRSVGRPDLARAMVASGAASSMKDAFSRHLHDGGPVDVPHSALPIAEALELGRAANAAMALAHPHLYDAHGIQLLRKHRADGLTGVEAFYGGYDGRERARWVELAAELDLVCTGGSDWHGPENAHTQLGIDLPADRADRILAWLAQS